LHGQLLRQNSWLLVLLYERQSHWWN
jgi:hypothetical protein